MALSPDFETIVNACLENADYDEDNSLAKAKAYRTACRQKLHYASKMMKGQSSAEFNIAEIREELKAVETWIAARDSDNNTFRPCFVRARPHQI
jgi:hypothetical protein